MSCEQKTLKYHPLSVTEYPYFPNLWLKQSTYYDVSDFDNQSRHNMILIISNVITKIVD